MKKVLIITCMIFSLFALSAEIQISIDTSFNFIYSGNYGAPSLGSESISLYFVGTASRQTYEVGLRAGGSFAGVFTEAAFGPSFALNRNVDFSVNALLGLLSAYDTDIIWGAASSLKIDLGRSNFFLKPSIIYRNIYQYNFVDAGISIGYKF